MKQRKFLEQRTGYGRSLAGDGATIQGTKYINFLAHEYTKGHMLAGLTDCTERLTDVGSVQSTFIAHHWMGAMRFVLFCSFIIANLASYITLLIVFRTCRYVGARGVYVIIYDGGADWVAAAAMVIAKFPWVCGVYCASHIGSLMVKDVAKIPMVGTTLTLTLTLTQYIYI